MIELAKVLHRAQEAGSIGDDEYKNLHSRFKGPDTEGAVWTLGLKDHVWNKKLHGKWVASRHAPVSINLPADLVAEIEKYSTRLKTGK